MRNNISILKTAFIIFPSKQTDMATIHYLDPIPENELKEVPASIRRESELSFGIVKRIYDILERKGWTQADLARSARKTEAEVSRWLSGTHNFTIRSISLLEATLGESIITVNQYRKNRESVSGYRVSPRKAAFLSDIREKYGKKSNGKDSVEDKREQD